VNDPTYAPGAGLVDRCTVSVDRDFHGERFGGTHFYLESPPGDLGAEERYDTIFRDGFEPKSKAVRHASFAGAESVLPGFGKHPSAAPPDCKLRVSSAMRSPARLRRSR